MLAGQFLVGGEGVVHQDIPAIALGRVFLFVDHGIAATFLQGGGGKLIAVKRRALQGKEDGPLRAVAAVGGELLPALQIETV